MIIIQDSLISINKEDLYDHVMTHVNLRFDIYIHIHISSKNHERSDFGLDVVLSTISYQSCGSYAKRSGLLGRTKPLKTHLRYMEYDPL